MDFTNHKTSQLLTLHCDINEELRRRGILRSANNPTGDLSEYLFCKAFKWEQAPNSEKGFDAIDENQIKYQIKGRRIHQRNKSRQLSAIRNLETKPFDVLAAILFDDDYRIILAALIPFDLVKQRSVYRQHTNSNLFHLRDSVLVENGVKDVTSKIASTLSKI